MLTEQITLTINKKMWGKDIKILNFNEYDVFNVEAYKEKMEFLFDDVNQTKVCKPEDLKDIETKLEEMLNILATDLHYPKQNIKFYKSVPIDPINPDLLHVNCYFTPAKLERKFLDGFTKDKYYEFQETMSYEEYLEKYSSIIRKEEPIIRNEEEATEYIKNSPLYLDFYNKIKDDTDVESQLNKYIELIKNTAKKDLECIDIDNKYIEGYSFKWCNGLYLTLALL